jgi:hypothetical protein
MSSMAARGADCQERDHRLWPTGASVVTIGSMAEDQMVTMRTDAPEQAAQAATAPTGWYPDPRDPGSLRWWDGRQWTMTEPPPDSGGASPEQVVRAESRLSVAASASVVVGAIVFVVWTLVPVTMFDGVILAVGALLVGAGIGIGVAARSALRLSGSYSARALSLVPTIMGGVVAAGMLVLTWWLFT